MRNTALLSVERSSLQPLSPTSPYLANGAICIELRSHDCLHVLVRNSAIGLLSLELGRRRGGRKRGWHGRITLPLHELDNTENAFKTLIGHFSFKI